MTIENPTIWRCICYTKNGDVPSSCEFSWVYSGWEFVAIPVSLRQEGSLNSGHVNVCCMDGLHCTDLWLHDGSIDFMRKPVGIWGPEDPNRSYHQEKNQDTTGRYVFAWRSDMKCRSLLSAHIIHELLTGSRLQLACCTTLVGFLQPSLNSSTQSSNGIPMLTPRLEIRKDFPWLFLVAPVLGAREKTCIFENMLIIM